MRFARKISNVLRLSAVISQRFAKKTVPIEKIQRTIYGDGETALALGETCRLLFFVSQTFLTLPRQQRRLRGARGLSRRRDVKRIGLRKRRIWQQITSSRHRPPVHAYTF